MNLTTFLMLFWAQLVLSTTDEVVIKSTISDTQHAVLVQISLPEDHTVSFSLFDQEDVIKHHWDARQLHGGQHQLALPLPINTQGKYLLHINVGHKVYRQLLYISPS